MKIYYFYFEDNSTKTNDLFDANLLPILFVLTHLIWTIVPIVILDQCCLSTHKSFVKILLKLLVCTCPLLVCNDLTFVFVCDFKSIEENFLLIVMKWFVCLSTIFVSFWTGTLSTKDKHHSLHGSKVSPELRSALYFSFS